MSLKKINLTLSKSKLPLFRTYRFLKYKFWENFKVKLKWLKSTNDWSDWVKYNDSSRLILSPRYIKEVEFKNIFIQYSFKKFKKKNWRKKKKLITKSNNFKFSKQSLIKFILFKVFRKLNKLPNRVSNKETNWLFRKRSTVFKWKIKRINKIIRYRYGLAYNIYKRINYSRSMYYKNYIFVFN